MGKPDKIVAVLLAWYDRHHRRLPWRVVHGGRDQGDDAFSGPTQRPNPYHVWLSEVMLQQTTVPTVLPYFKKFIALWPRVGDLAQATREAVLWAWQGLGYYSRAHRLHETAQHIHQRLDGRFPTTYKELLSLPGVGPYTASAIGAIAFNLPLPVVDANVERLIGRLYAIRSPKAQLKQRVYEILAAFPLDGAGFQRPTTPGDLAQSMMDFANQVCLSSKPLCDRCPLATMCLAHQQGCVGDIPQKLDKAKPTRRALFFLLHHPTTGGVVLYRRPDKGLLPGMMCLPSTPWVPWATDDSQGSLSPGKRVGSFTVLGQVRHTFTHFHLDATVIRRPLEDHLARALDATHLDEDPALALDRMMTNEEDLRSLGILLQGCEPWLPTKDIDPQTPFSGLLLHPLTSSMTRFVKPADLDQQALPTLVRKVLALGSA